MGACRWQWPLVAGTKKGEAGDGMVIQTWRGWDEKGRGDDVVALRQGHDVDEVGVEEVTNGGIARPWRGGDQTKRDRGGVRLYLAEDDQRLT